MKRYKSIGSTLMALTFRGGKSWHNGESWINQEPTP